MAEIPEGAIPVDQFEALHNAPAGPIPTHTAPHPQAIPVDQFESSEDAYGSAGQMAKTFVEGASEGVLGPLAPAIEKEVLRVKPEDIRGRAEENPISHGVGTATGLVGGAMTDVGLPAALGKAGEMAAVATGVAKGTEAIKAAEMGVQAAKAAGKGIEEAQGALKAAKAMTPTSWRVGDSAVRQAAEMAVLQGSDETSKMILNDPNTSAESAIANIGLAAALGGAGGAFVTGAVNPLWEAVAAPRVESLLNSVKDHFSGGKAMLPEDLKMAQQTLGVNIASEMQAAMSGNPTAVNSWGILREGQNTKVVNALKNWDTEASESIAKSLGIAPEDVAVHSENEAGHSLLDTWKKEFDKRYQPVADALNKRDTEAAGITISDDARLHKYGQLIEQGMQDVGTDSPMYKLYNDWGNRLLAKETIGGVDQLKTEIGNEIKKAMRAGDDNTVNALRSIRSSFADFQESQIASDASKLGKAGIGEAKQMGEDLLAQRAAANKGYKEFADLSNQLTDHLGIGDFKGAGRLKGKLTDGVSAEQLLNKFSIKGNADFIPFLQKNFPETYAKVIENEQKRFLKPAVLSAKGESPINIKKLNDIIEKGMAGQPEYIKAIMPPEALNKIAAANKLNEAIPSHKSSGTAGWMTKMFSDMPRSALAGVAMLSGHNPLFGGLLGEMAQRLGRDAPDAIRLAHLKFMGSDQPISPNGFKAMVDFFHNTIVSEKTLNKSIGNMFKRGAQVIAESAIPTTADRLQLDKIVTKMQSNPAMFAASQKGQTGDYLPQHQQALAETNAKALQYLQTLKPQPHILGPLDKPVPPQPSEIARYNRALDIAQNPHVVLKHIQDGTLMPSDIMDLHNMYPGLYKSMVTKMSNQMNTLTDEGKAIPYKQRLSMSLFMGAPTDATMTPQAIVAAQPIAKPKNQPQGGGQQRRGGSPSKIGSNNKSYMTPSQSSEAHKNNKD